MKPDIKKKSARRLKIIEGQIRGLQRMVEHEDYCVDILTQSLAVREALSGVDDLIMENHLTTHVAHQMRSNEEKKAVKEVMVVYKLSKRGR